VSLLGQTPSSHTTAVRRLFARASMLLFVGVLCCVPGLTRVNQRINTSAAPTLSFSKSTECPPEKVSAARVALEIVYAFPCVPAPARTLRQRRWPATSLPLSPALVSPRPLRAPPAALFA